MIARRFRATVTLMPTEHLIALLVAEGDKLNRAIEALQGPHEKKGPSAEEFLHYRCWCP